MVESSPWSFSLSREDILTRRMKREQIADEIEGLQRQLEAEDKWLEAVRLIVPAELLSGIDDAVAGAKEGPAHGSIWRQAIADALAEADRGLLPKDIALFIKERGNMDVKERLVRNPNGIYNALSRMHNEAQIIKHGDKFYRHSLFEELSAADELDSDAGFNLKGPNLFIIKAIKELGEAPPRTIIEMLRNSEEFGERQINNPQYGYSAIQRLVRQRLIEKMPSGCYQLVSKENEPSDVRASNGSDAGLSHRSERMLDFDP